MKFPLVRRSRVALLLALSSLCAYATTVPGVSVLKVTAPNGATSTIVATIHAPVDGLPQPAPSVMDGAAQYVVEGSTEVGPQPPQPDYMATLTPEAKAAMITQAMAGLRSAGGVPDLPPAPWAKSITPAQFALFRSRLICNGVTTEANATQYSHLLLAFETAMPAYAVATRPCARAGLVSRDDQMARAAKKYGIPLTVLESQVDAEAKRKAVPESVYRDSVYWALSDAEPGAVRAVADAIAQGDYDRALAGSMAGISSADAKTFQDLMVTSRNKAWVPVLAPILQKGRAVIVVGAAHLGGPQGLIALLRSIGYRVARDAVPADTSM